MQPHLEEMVRVIFPKVVMASRFGVIPALESQGMKVRDHGEDFGDIQTDQDVKASDIFLNGSDELGVVGVRSDYPGSFSEEDDAQRHVRLWGGRQFLFVNDPCDGTGDLKKSLEGQLAFQYDPERKLYVPGGEPRTTPISPTNLTAKLELDAETGRYRPVAGMIYHVLGEYALVSDGVDILLGKVGEDNEFVPVAHRNLKMATSGEIAINRRLSYPQSPYDDEFFTYLREQGFDVRQQESGGAGTQFLQLFRSVFDVSNKKDLRSFRDLPPLSVITNAQNDWKEWDTLMAVLMAELLGFGEIRDFYGGPLQGDIMGYNLKPDMVHTTGVSVGNPAFIGDLREAAKAYEIERAPTVGVERMPSPTASLLHKNY